MKRWLVALLAVLVFVSSGLTVWADDGHGQAVLPGESVTIRPGEEIQGDLAVIGGTLELQEGGRVDGDVAVLGGSAIIDGEIDGNLAVLGGSVDLRAHALVRSDFFAFGAGVTRDPGATIQGETVETLRGRLPRLPTIETWRTPRPWTGGDWNVFDVMGQFLRFVLSTLAMIALGVLLVLLLPKPTATVEKAVAEAAVTSFAVGVLTFLVLLVLVPLLVIICIGIPVAILVVMVAVAAGLFGWSVVGILFGRRLLVALKGQPQPAVEAMIGIALLAVLAEVPCLGWLLACIVGATGMGAVVLTRFGTVNYAPPKPASAALTPPSEPPAA